VLLEEDDEESDHLGYLVDLLTVCECKSNPKRNRPWLVFTEPGRADELTSRTLAHHGTRLGEWLLSEFANSQDAGTLSLFTEPRIGYSARCATLCADPRENQQDTAYEAVQGLLDAVRVKAKAKRSAYLVFRIVIPVIVLDADLYECWLDEHAELQLEARDEMALLVKHPGLGTKSQSIVYIVTEPKLPTLCSRLREALDYFMHQGDAMDAHIEELIEEAQELREREAAKKSAARERRVARKKARRPRSRDQKPV
jgi:hypothetical protein